jgi:hypothetical protein
VESTLVGATLVGATLVGATLVGACGSDAYVATSDASKIVSNRDVGVGVAPTGTPTTNFPHHTNTL